MIFNPLHADCTYWNRTESFLWWVSFWATRVPQYPRNENKSVHSCKATHSRFPGHAVNYRQMFNALWLFHLIPTPIAGCCAWALAHLHCDLCSASRRLETRWNSHFSENNFITSAEKTSDGSMKLLVRKCVQSLKIKLPRVVFLVTNREKYLSAGSEWAEFRTHMTWY